MAMKAYACPRCLTLSSECKDGDGGPHECEPSPLVQKLETERDRYCRALHHIADSYAGDLSVEDCQHIADEALNQ